MLIFLGSHQIEQGHDEIRYKQKASSLDQKYLMRNLSNADMTYFSDMSIITRYTFRNCTSLTSVIFNNCESIGSEAFRGCTSLQNISFPKCTFIGEQAFYICYSLQSAIFSQCSIIQASAFLSCRSLSTASFPQCISIGGYAFASCYNLISLYLRGGTVISLVSTAFISTPISNYTTSTDGVYGSIYVPSSLYASYIADTNWSIYSARIVSL